MCLLSVQVIRSMIKAYLIKENVNTFYPESVDTHLKSVDTSRLETMLIKFNRNLKMNEGQHGSQWIEYIENLTHSWKRYLEIRKEIDA